MILKLYYENVSRYCWPKILKTFKRFHILLFIFSSSRKPQIASRHMRSLSVFELANRGQSCHLMYFTWMSSNKHLIKQ